MTDFKVGDRVQVVDNLGSFASYAGSLGTVIREGAETFDVKFDGRSSHLAFYSEELEKVDD